MTLFLCYFETGPALLLLKPAIVGQDYLPETKLMQKERPQRNDITLCRTHPTKENAEILTAESLCYRRSVLVGSGCSRWLKMHARYSQNRGKSREELCWLFSFLRKMFLKTNNLIMNYCHARWPYIRACTYSHSPT